MKREQSPGEQLLGFLSRFEPEIAALTESALVKLRKRLPHAVEMVYDNYNALVIGFGPTMRASDAILSIGVYPRHISLFFLNGARLSDPKGLLLGSGKQVRHIRLEEAEALDDPEVRALIARALEFAEHPMDSKVARRLVIKSVSAKQRPRRRG